MQPDRSRECHLGDVAGEPFPPTMAPYRSAFEREQDWVGRLNRGFLAALATLLLALIVALMVAGAFLLAAKPSAAFFAQTENSPRGRP